ncbi:MAG: ABC transporter permease [Acidobacteriota bacterium]|nr:MAG: ABC transporter permease [Acidobacteriota bacterium]
MKSRFDSLIADLRYGMRILYRNPGFTAVAVLSLGLVIGANATVFSVLNSMLFRTVPHDEPERLVRLRETNLGQPDWPRNPTFPTVREWSQGARSFEGIGMVADSSVTLSSRGHAEPGEAAWVSPNLFSLLGIEPQLGRDFTSDDAPYDLGQVAVISDGYWHRRFGADPNILGESLVIAGVTTTIVGVMPRGFWIYPWSDQTDAWQVFNTSQNKYAPTTRWFDAIGRLKPGVTLEQARQELVAINRHLGGRGASAAGKWQAGVESLQASFFSGWEEIFYLLFAISLTVLLIGSANIANMLLARVSRREKEIAIRLAVGAGRFRLIRQLLTESVLLSLLGGVAGLFLTLWGVQLFVVLAPQYWTLRGDQMDIDGRVLIFTLLVSLFTGICLGLAPAFRCSRPNLTQSLKEGLRRSAGGGHPFLRGMLIVSEISLALALLVGAGLMVNSFLRLQIVDPGYDPSNLLEARIFLQGPQYWEFIEGDMKKVTPGAHRFFEELVERVERLPGVDSAALTGRAGCSFRILGKSSTQAERQPRTSYRSTDEDYFRTVGIPLLRGRTFTEQDGEGSRWVAVVNETLAKRFFSDQDPIGNLIQADFGGANLGFSVEEGHSREIIGVVGDEKGGLGWEPWPTIYVPQYQHIWEFPGASYYSVVRKDLLVRAGNSMDLAPSIERIIAEIDPNQAADRIRTMEQRLSDSIQYWRFWMKLFLFSAILAVVLVVVGVFGVLSYSVTERSHEIGVRMAIGAQRGRVLAMVMGSGLKMTLIGLAVGVGISLALSRIISSYLFGVSPNDPVTYAVVALLLIGTVMVASYIPARRATQVSPLIALKYE